MNNYLSVDAEQEWTDFVDRSVNNDVYHCWHYHQLDKTGKPVLFVYKEEKFFIALPLIKREIPGTPWYDLTSVYGYTGPISDRKFEDISIQSIVSFRSQFLDFMKEHQCICVFARLHPFSSQYLLLQKIGGVMPNGRTVYMDLTQDLHKQREKYEKRLLRQLRSDRKRGFKIRETSQAEDIEAFAGMYTENMRRVSASKNYFFTQEYFNDLLLNQRIDSKLLMLYDKGKPACGAVVFHSKDIIRIHLSATSNEYLKDSPSKLLTDEVSLLGRKLKLDFFHLGGGVGGKEDSLFYFKSRFSDLWKTDYTWRFIADTASYNLLLEMKGISKTGTSDFFPVYRSPQYLPGNISRESILLEY